MPAPKMDLSVYRQFRCVKCKNTISISGTSYDHYKMARVCNVCGTPVCNNPREESTPEITPEEIKRAFENQKIEPAQLPEEEESRLNRVHRNRVGVAVKIAVALLEHGFDPNDVAEAAVQISSKDHRADRPSQRKGERLKIDVTQFKRPFGDQSIITGEIDDSLLPQFNEMTALGCFVTMEVIGGMVSICIDDGEDDVDCEITPNGPSVKVKLEEMIRRFTKDRYIQIKEEINAPTIPDDEEAGK